MAGKTYCDRVCAELLESRCLLSWPDAPFAGTDYENTLFVNQFGDAYLPSKAISPKGDFDGYRLHFDEPGAITIRTDGVPAQLAYYLGAGPPARTADNPSGGSAVSLRSRVPDRRLVFVGVKAALGDATGKYGLYVDGPPEGHIDVIKVSARTHAGSDGSDITPASDYDFFSFTTTRAGIWSVTVIPDRTLDPTLNVFDDAGVPIGGSFTKPINRGGVGQGETWVSTYLTKGQTVVLRVDGRGNTTGGINVLVHYGKPVTVSITAVTPTSVEGGDAAVLRVARSGTATRAIPLTVHYAVSGSATPGTDYPALSGTIVIPIGQSAASILVWALADELAETSETVRITLLTSATYTLGKSRTATADLLDR